MHAVNTGVHSESEAKVYLPTLLRFEDNPKTPCGSREGADKYLQAVVTLKHWMAYTVENYHNVTRHTFDAKVSAWDLVESYLPQWEMVVKEAGAKGVMCSYNMVNGKPTCGNRALTEILLRQFNFTGYVTSDTDSCADIYESHKYVKTAEEAVRSPAHGQDK